MNEDDKEDETVDLPPPIPPHGGYEPPPLPDLDDEPPPIPIQARSTAERDAIISREKRHAIIGAGIGIVVLLLLAIGGPRIWSKLRGSDGSDSSGASSPRPQEAAKPLAESKITLPAAYGLYWVDKGKTMEVGQYAEIPDFSPGLEFIMFHKMVAMGAGDSVHVFEINLEPPPQKPEKPDSEKSSAEFWDDFLKNADANFQASMDRLEGRPSNSRELACQTQPVKDQPEMIRVIPRAKLAPGLYQVEAQRFFVQREKFVTTLREEAFAAQKSKSWAEAHARASTALAVAPDDAAMKKLLAEIPYQQAASLAEDALSRQQWDEAVAAANVAVKIVPGDKTALGIVRKAKTGKFKALETKADDLFKKGEKVQAFEAFEAVLRTFEGDADYVEDCKRVSSTLDGIQAEDRMNPAFWRQLLRVQVRPKVTTDYYPEQQLQMDLSVNQRDLVTLANLGDMAELKLWRLDNGQLMDRGVLVRGDCKTPVFSWDGGLLSALYGYSALAFWDTSKESAHFGLYLECLAPMSNEARKRNVPDGALLVKGTDLGSPANNAGLLPDDLIVEVNGHPVSKVAWDQVQKSCFTATETIESQPGRAVILTLIRKGATVIANVTPTATLKSLGTMTTGRSLNGNFWVPGTTWDWSGGTMFDPINGKWKFAFPFPFLQDSGNGQSDYFSAFALSKNGLLALAMEYKKWKGESHRNIIFVGNSKDEKPIDILPGHIDRPGIKDVVFNDSGTMLASVADDNSIILWDMKTFREIQTFGKLEGFYVRSGIVFANNDKCLVSGGPNRAVAIWDVDRGEVIRELPIGFLKFQLSADKKFFAAACTDGTIQIWGTKNALSARPVEVASAKNETTPSETASATEIIAVDPSPEDTPVPEVTSVPEAAQEKAAVAETAVAVETPRTAATPSPSETDATSENGTAPSQPEEQPPVAEAGAPDPASSPGDESILIAAKPLEHGEYSYLEPPACVLTFGGAPRGIELVREDVLFVFGTESRTWKQRYDKPSIREISQAAAEDSFAPNINTHAMDSGRDYKLLTSVHENSADGKVIFSHEFKYRLINPELSPAADSSRSATPITQPPKSESETAGSLKDLRRLAASARASASAIIVPGRQTYQRDLLRDGDDFMATSKKKESEGDMESARFWAKKARDRYKEAEKKFKELKRQGR